MATLSEQIAQYKQRQHQKRRCKTCSKCNRTLQETVTGNRQTADGSMCSDCYYEQLGAIIEQHPIVAPRAYRG